jgi:hypothetical protein
MNKKIYTQEEFESKVAKLNPNIKIMGKYKGCTVKVKVQCKIDKYIWDTDLAHIERGEGCPVCKGLKAFKGFKDLWILRPDIAKLLKNKEHGYNLLPNSRKREVFICPNCGNEINSSVHNVSQNGLFCRKCSSGVKYPESFMYNLLLLLNVKFETQKTFIWSENKRYDFYFIKNGKENIVECNGIQHYSNPILIHGNGRTLKEEQDNDKFKKQLAKENGINDDHYIVIDCRYSNMEWIRDHILSSKLVEMFDLSNINWTECERRCIKSRVISVCNLYNNGIKQTKDISRILSIPQRTVVGYLNKGSQVNLCDYDGRKARIEGSNHKVICLNNFKIFNSVKEAETFYHISNISACCIGTIKSAGKLSGHKLIWMYYDEYLQSAKSEKDLSA